MNACMRVVLSLVCLVPVITTAQEQTAEAPPPVVQELGEERFQIGDIVVDKARGEFTVPGRVLRADPPLEYIAVTVGGAKAYESLLELTVTGTEFNLACILVGLDNAGITLPRYQFDPEPTQGQAVTITASWQTDAGPMEAPIEMLLSLEGEAGPASDWQYLGSFQQGGPYGGFAADLMGTLIGFVHDPASVIEHRLGLGMGNYGAVGGNMALLPPEGSAISLTIKVRGLD